MKNKMDWYIIYCKSTTPLFQKLENCIIMSMTSREKS